MNTFKILALAFSLVVFAVAIGANAQNAECGENEFQCLNGAQCIPGDYLCDKNNDCLDGSDELNCTYTCDSKYEHTCSDGKCIPWYYVCDTHRDCSDSGDEKNCPCEGGFVCESDNLCIPAEFECDITIDCDDESDERNCTCNEDQFDCGICINKKWVCDYVPDCPDHSDERDCNYTMARLPPLQFEFLQLNHHMELRKEEKVSKSSQIRAREAKTKQLRDSRRELSDKMRQIKKSK